MAVSFIAEGNQSTRRKPTTCSKSLASSHKVVSSTPRHEWTLNNVKPVLRGHLWDKEKVSL